MELHFCLKSADIHLLSVVHVEGSDVGIFNELQRSEETDLLVEEAEVLEG